MFRRRSRPEDVADQEVRFDLDLGRTDLDVLAARAEAVLAHSRATVVLRMTSFTYFDSRMLDLLTGLMDRHVGRLRVEGTEQVAEALMPSEEQAEPGPRLDRAAVTMNNTVVVRLLVDGVPLSEPEVEAVLDRVTGLRQPLVAVDFLGVADLSPALCLALGELSGDLRHEGRTLLCVNVTPEVAENLRTAGLAEGVHVMPNPLL